MFSVFLKCSPPKATAQSTRFIKIVNGKPQVFMNNRGAYIFGEILTLLKANKPKEPFQSALAVEVEWVYPKRKLDSEDVERIPCDKRPDIDNILKAFFDLCTKAKYFDDDSQIAQLTASKWYGDNPGIKLSIKKL